MKLADLRTRFDALNAREQRWLLWGAVATALLLVLGLGVWPALRSWRASAPAHQQMAQLLPSHPRGKRPQRPALRAQVNQPISALKSVWLHCFKRLQPP